MQVRNPFDIACISDTHLPASIGSRSFFPRQMEALPEREARKLYARISEAIHDAFVVGCEWVGNSGSSLCVHFGDVTSGWQERGVVNPEAQALLAHAKTKLEERIPNVEFCLGNHDTGYAHPGSLPGSGISQHSVAACREIIGKLYWYRMHEGVLLVGLCSSLAGYKGDDSWLLDEKYSQEHFLTAVLQSHPGVPWVLCAHEPTTAHDVAHVIAPHLDRLVRYVYGDKHASWAGKWTREQARLFSLLPAFGRRAVALHCLRMSSMCPSTAPLWWQGYGNMRLTISGAKCADETVLHQPPDWALALPTASPVRCVLWMLRPYSHAL